MGDLADLDARTRTSTARIDFSASDRKTKRLIELEDVAYEIENRTLFEKLNFILTAGMRVGLVGPNGSGKTTLLRLLRGERTATSGDIRRRMVAHRILRSDSRARFQCNLAPRPRSGRRFGDLPGPGHSRSVMGARFLFTGEQLNQARRTAFGRRTRASADRATHAPTCRCVVAG